MSVEIKGIVIGIICHWFQDICPVGRLSKLTVSAVYFGSKQGWLCPFILLGCVSLIQWNVFALLEISV